MTQTRPVVPTVSVDHDATAPFVARPEPRLSWTTDTTATVELAGGATVRVGSGVHTWTS